MDFSLDLLLATGKLAPKVISIGSFGIYLTTLGNPRSLRESRVTLDGLKSWPPTALFRWRRQKPRDGYEVTAYNRKTDEDDTLFPVFHLAKYCPTYLMWPKNGQRTRNAMLRTARITLAVKVFFFFAFFLGSFAALAWLTFTQNWRWTVALVVLTVHQLVFLHSNTYFKWLRWPRLLLICAATWLYLQGGWYETAAICGLGAVLTLMILNVWQMTTSSRFRYQRMREHGYGVLDPKHERGKPW